MQDARDKMQDARGKRFRLKKNIRAFVAKKKRIEKRSERRDRKKSKKIFVDSCIRGWKKKIQNSRFKIQNSRKERRRSENQEYPALNLY